MPRRGMLSREEEDRAAADRAGGVAAHAGGFANSGKAAVQRGAFGGLRRWLRPGQGRGALGAGIIPRSASDSTNRTSSACREMDSFR